MPSKKEIILKHKKNLEIIKLHNKNYYIKDKPIITDAEYDKIKIEALKLEKSYAYLGKLESIDSIIGAKPLNKFKKFKHLSPMLSLSNAFNLEDIKDFQKKFKIF